MKISWRTITRPQAARKLLPELTGRVFHITAIPNFIRIIQTGAIRHNKDGELPTNWSHNSFFRNRGCVSFCDLHNNIQPRKVREAAFSKYSIIDQGDGERFAYLFLAPSSYDRLVPWTNWKKQQAWSEAIVPHLESGYPGFVPLDQIEEALLIHIPISEAERNSKAALEAALQRLTSKE